MDIKLTCMMLVVNKMKPLISFLVLFIYELSVIKKTHPAVTVWCISHCDFLLCLMFKKCFLHPDMLQALKSYIIEILSL